MKKAFLIIMLLAPIFVFAQTESDMLDYSTIYYQGTAKSAAMGNAMGAVGNDFSAIAINPASLGMFRKSSFIYTLGFNTIYSKSVYQNNNDFDINLKLKNNNIGLTWTQDINDGGLSSVSFALGINRLNDYSLNSFVNGDNANTSLVDAYFNEMANNNIGNSYDLEDYSYDILYPLYQTYIIDTIYSVGDYATWVPQGGLNQRRSVVKRGDAKEFTFSTGFNFNEKFFFGVSVNVPYFDKKTHSTYTETNLTSEYFKNWSQEEIVASSGAGINAKFGVIVFPAKWIRLGASFHSPTLYKVTDSWYTKTSSSMGSFNGYYETEVATSRYNVTTPYRFNASTAFIFGNFGMITADYEYVDYTFMRASGYDYTNLNNFIKDTYKSTSNFRIGTEWRWQTFAFRAGYAFYGSPYGIDNSNLRTNSYSCGFGYTYNRFTLDIAYVLSRRENAYDLYSQYSFYPAYYGDNNEFVDDTKVKETTNIHQMVISFKFRLD